MVMVFLPFFGFMLIGEGDFFLSATVSYLVSSLVQFCLIYLVGLKSKSQTAKSRRKFGGTASNDQDPCLALRGLGFWLRYGVRM